jgi:hypothetical protein
MVLLKLKNILNNYKYTSFHSDYFIKLPEEDIKLLKEYHAKVYGDWYNKDPDEYFPSIHEKLLSHIRSIDDKERLENIRGALVDMEPNKRNLDYLSFRGMYDDANATKELPLPIFMSRAGRLISHNSLIKELNEKLGLDPYEDIHKESYHLEIGVFLSPARLTRYYDSNDKDGRLYYKGLENIARHVISKDPELRQKIENHFNEIMNKYPEDKHKVRSKYNLFIKPHLESKETASPTQKIVEGSK